MNTLNKPSLFEIQNNLQNYLLGKQTTIQQAMTHSKHSSADERLMIYRNAHRTRLRDALVNNYPILNQYLGVHAFNIIADEYISQYPSIHRSIRWFGDCLVDFLKNSDREYLGLCEFAQFEWSLALAFDAQDEATLTIKQIANIPAACWPKMQLIPHPSLQRMDFYWNVVSLWEKLTKNQPADLLRKQTDYTSWVVWRKDDANQFYELKKEEAWALDALINRATFEELCEGLGQWLDPSTIDFHAASLLKGWIQLGLLSRVIT